MSKRIKALISIVVVSIILAVSLMPTGALEIKRYFGDVDNDGYITTVDARIVLMCVAGIYDKTLMGLDFEAADIDNDGTLTTIDARTVLKTAAGQLEEKFMTGYEFSEHHEEFIELVNDHRFEKNHKAVKLTLSNELCDAARIAAQEYALKTGNAFVRDDGTLFYKLLDENGIEYSFADKIVIHSGFGCEGAVEDMLNDIQAEKALSNTVFTKIGLGAYSTDNRTFYWCVFLIR